jgi:hypothetical protein
MTPPDLRKPVDCLAYTVLCDDAKWLGAPSPTALAVFLSGTAQRVDLTRAAVSEWSVYGPLEQPWSTALELHHFALT